MRKPQAHSKTKRPPSGGSLGAFLLSTETRSVKASSKPAISPSHGAEPEAEWALSIQSLLPLLEGWGSMLNKSPSFAVAWQQAAGIALTERRLLIRAQKLVHILKRLGTTRHRMGHHGLKACCCLGTRTTLYRLSDVLAAYVIAAHQPAKAVANDLALAFEQIVFDGLSRTHGPEVRAKYLTVILGGSKPRDWAIISGALVPSIKRHRCVLFPLHGLERAVRALSMRFQDASDDYVADRSAK